MLLMFYAAHHPRSQIYETKVIVVFKDEETMTVLSFFFKSYNVLSSCEIQLILYFPAPEEFKEFAEMRAEETITR